MQPDAIQRCLAEIAAMEQQPENAPAWLTTLGITDWEYEMELLYAIETGQGKRSDPEQHTRVDQHGKKA